MILLPEDSWECRTTQERGRGIFIKKEISPGKVLGDFIGKLLLEKDIHEPPWHFFESSLSDELSILPDDSVPGVHTINHSCVPNCDAYPYKGHLIFFALRRLFPGEELVFSYALSPPDYETEPCRHFCKCHTPLCRGTMHTSYEDSEKWYTFLKEQNGPYLETIKEQLGKDIKPFDSYPETIEDLPIYDIYGCEKLDPLVCEEATLPEVSEIRKRIRESGRQLLFNKIALQIYGVMNNFIVGNKI